MAEQTLSELVKTLIGWVEALHQKNLKSLSQIEVLQNQLTQANNRIQELEASVPVVGNIIQQQPTYCQRDPPPPPQIAQQSQQPQLTALNPPQPIPVPHHQQTQLLWYGPPNGHPIQNIAYQHSTTLVDQQQGTTVYAYQQP